MIARRFVSITPFLCGLLTCPAFILLHECGHYLAGLSVGWHPTLRYATTDFTVLKEKFREYLNVFLTAAGPLLGAIFAAIGFVWLRISRLRRPDAPATASDWLATSLLVFNTGRWLRGFVWTPTHPQPDDEAYISRGLGMPGYMLPYLLAIVAVILLVAAIRLHPPGSRLVPFSFLGVGGILGTLFWLKLLGPFLLP